MLIKMVESYACPEYMPLTAGTVYDMDETLAKKLLAVDPPPCVVVASARKVEDVKLVDKDSTPIKGAK